MRVGAQPVGSLYRTLNRMVVVGDPEPGDAFPLLSDGIPCEPPLQLAASTDPVRAGMRNKPAAATIAMTATSDVRFGALGILTCDLKVEAGFVRVVGHIDTDD
jgi:hypothetical protein